MFEVLEIGDTRHMVYVTVDEKDLVEKLFRIKGESAIYYKKGKKIAYHWNLNPITVKKRLGDNVAVVPLPPE